MRLKQHSNQIILMGDSENRFVEEKHEAFLPKKGCKKVRESSVLYTVFHETSTFSLPKIWTKMSARKNKFVSEGVRLDTGAQKTVI